MVAPSPAPAVLACRRRLADGPRGRWSWALAASLLFTGLPPLMAGGATVLLWHGIRRRTWLPAVYGLTLFGGFAFALATLDALLTPPLRIAAAAVFAFGHHQGQVRAARDGRRWLALDG